MRIRPLALGAVLLLAAGRVWAADFSTDRGNPTAVVPTGRIVGRFPADEVVETYYVTATMAAGPLLVRMQYVGSGEVDKEIEFSLMAGERPEQPVALRGSRPADDQTQVIQMKAPGPHVFALTVRGPTEAGFCLLLGGAAFPTPPNVPCDIPGAPKPGIQPVGHSAPPPQPESPPLPAAPPAPEPEPCERRIRFESDDLFSGSTATLRDDAGPLLAAVGRQLLASQQAVRVECDTDVPGAPGRQLSQQRAAAVREFFLAFGVRAARVDAQGFGATRPLVQGKKPGSPEAPENRRVEIVICPS